MLLMIKDLHFLLKAVGWWLHLMTRPLTLTPHPTFHSHGGEERVGKGREGEERLPVLHLTGPAHRLA